LNIRPLVISPTQTPFSFLEAPHLVNAKKVKAKLPALLINRNTSMKENFSAYYRYRYRLKQLHQKQLQKADTTIAQLLAFLVAYEQAMEDAVN
jgi:hypothetical protein